jgi:hypothetical protein
MKHYKIWDKAMKALKQAQVQDELELGRKLANA